MEGVASPLLESLKREWVTDEDIEGFSQIKKRPRYDLKVFLKK
jgi:hypothetical protein